MVTYRDGGAVTRCFTSKHKLRALLVDMTLAAPDGLHCNRLRQLQYMFPLNWQEHLDALNKQGFRDP
eukprot:174366-Alexandrium_andersonii.AAC.1